MKNTRLPIRQRRFEFRGITLIVVLLLEVCFSPRRASSRAIRHKSLALRVWLKEMNEFEGNFERAEMVKAFLVSGEYRDRFWQQ